MKLRITASTDHQFLGFEFDAADNPVVMPNGNDVFIDRIMILDDGIRFVSSNYIFDTIEVMNNENQ